MSFFRKIVSFIMGSSEASLINAKKEIQYSADKMMYKAEAEALEKMILRSYEQSLEEIIYILGNAARHHAHLSPENQFKTSPFIDRFTEYYALEIYTKGVSLGYQVACGAADVKFQEETNLILKDLNDRMLIEAGRYFSQKESECFTIAGHQAFELGVEVGNALYDQEHMIIPL